MGFLDLLLAPAPDGAQRQYEALPSHTRKAVNSSRRVLHLSSRRGRFCVLSLFLLPFLLAVAFWVHTEALLNALKSPSEFLSLPPNYKSYYAAERDLPQHNLSLSFPEGENGRYMRVKERVWGLGWNNALQEMYMLSHMAYLSNRATVLRPYTWYSGVAPYVRYNGKFIPSRVPVSALLSGPIAGGPFPSSHPAPRAITEEWWDTVCPKSKTITIQVDLSELANAESREIMNRYVTALRDSTDSCVEIESNSVLFDFHHFGTTRILSMWSSLSQSPVLTNFAWSPLVYSAVQFNADITSPRLAEHQMPNEIGDLMTIHIRRGDFEEHCYHLAKWRSTYQGLNQLPALMDKFTPVGDGNGVATRETRAAYVEHCWPDIDRIVQRVGEARQEWEAHEGVSPLRRLYILTNGKPSWILELKQRLQEAGHWDFVYSSRDLILDREQKFISQAVDMAIAERAALFVGNGFSSMTANIVLLRTVRHLSLDSNRFW